MNFIFHGTPDIITLVYRDTMVENAALEGGAWRKSLHVVGFLSSFGTNLSRQEAPAAREEAFTSTHKPITVGGQSQVAVGTTHISRLTDDQLIKEFLSGSYCLHGVSPGEPPRQRRGGVASARFTPNCFCVAGSRLVEVRVLLRETRPSVPRGKH